jgi:ABC-type nitrate/sulfonate/bicarbonate transport system substrate-binding protein
MVRFVTRSAMLMAAIFLFIAGCPPAWSQTKISIAFPDAIGAWLTPLMLAQQQGIFSKHNIEVIFVPAAGATVPRVSDAVPLGLIGAPAALIQAEHGTDLKLIASFYRAHLSGKLVARGISSVAGLRGRRIGVRVIGAGIWIDTVVALRQLQIEPTAVEFVAVGGPPQILKALEDGSIDAALLPDKPAEVLRAKGYAILIDKYPPNLSTYEASLVAASSIISSQPDLVYGVLESLVDATKLMHRPENRELVIQALAAALKLPHDQAEQHYGELKNVPEYPKPSLETLKAMQTVMAYHNPDILKVRLENLVDEQFLHRLSREH